MALISLQDITLNFGGPLLFDKITLQLERGERVALLGRNGVGKTTLMKAMAGQIELSSGTISYQREINITHLPQELPTDLTGQVFDIVLSGLGEQAKIVADYHHVMHRMQTDHSDAILKQLDVLQAEMDRTNSWDIDRQVELVISQMKLDPESQFEELSGGQKRRVLLAKALVLSPEILLLDEPTNHLDIDSIDWLEGFLKNYEGTIFFVTHDRMFLQRLATKIVELDRGKLFSWACDYPTFLERKQAALEVEANQRVEFAKKLSIEEAWIRKGIRARRTRNEGRVRALEGMREEKRAQRQVIGKARMTVQDTGRSGQNVVKAKNISFGYDKDLLIDNFSTQIMRGDKIGVIGPNGSGKTTLLNILLGKLKPQEGTLELGTNLKTVYFDQLRSQLDENKTVQENVCLGADTLTINGQPRHVIGYLQDFLFSPERARTPVKVLSGGERNRLLLARLFTQTFNLLVMDEPTNDLDVETLELLEELLVDYSGTLLLVSHDRAFLNNVVTSTIVLTENGQIEEYVGGYDDWLKCHQAKLNREEEATKVGAKTKNLGQLKKRQLSYNEQQVLKSLPALIEKLEGEQDTLAELMAAPSFFKKNPEEIKTTQAQMISIQEDLLCAYQKWEDLEGPPA